MIIIFYDAIKFIEKSSRTFHELFILNISNLEKRRILNVPD
jgi:hypothetical protein